MMRASNLPEKAEAVAFFENAKLIESFAFLLIPQFSMISLISAVEVLRMANHLMERDVYRWSLTSPHGGPVCASEGLVVDTVAAGTISRPQILFVVAGPDAQRATSAAHLIVLRHFAKIGSVIGSLCTGAYALARAGLLAGYRCASHWDNTLSIAENFPETTFIKQLFVVDRDRVTCSGGLAPYTLMLRMITPRVGPIKASQIAQHLKLEGSRDPEPSHDKALALRPGKESGLVLEVIGRMGDSVEDPLDLESLARLGGISERRLQRLFQIHLGASPVTFYRSLRLMRARQLVRHGEMSIFQIAVSCGFASLSHFGRVYREEFGSAPSDDRKRTTDLRLLNISN
jgi:AraC family transcriptional regulator, glycine betaine-responsive activator